jgi:tellurite resistance protein TehA-like permease
VLLLAGLSVHEVLPKAPEPLVVKLTVPVGVLAVAVSVSVTVAVQVEGCPIATFTGEQSREVEVERACTVTAVLPLVAGCAESPP